MFAPAWVIGVVLLIAAVAMADAKDLPLLDPDNILPGYIRMPLILLAAIALDVVPRIIWRSIRGTGSVLSAGRAVMRERWPASHWWFAVSGVAAWYVSYAAFRNVKSMAPFVHTEIYDDELQWIDEAMFFGNEPAAVLHDLLGTDVAATVLSSVYMVWIALIPVSIAIALVWTRHTTAGAWYVTALSLDWFLGAALYVLVPTVGPVYSDPTAFAALPETYVSRLQESMWGDRLAVLADPVAAGHLQTIAAFASLHVGIMVTICLTLVFINASRWVRIAAWTFLALTCVSTVYLGWHFVIDVVAGFAVGAAAVWIAAWLTGNHVRLRPRLTVPQPDPSPEPALD